MTYEELRKLVSGYNPQAASYEDIISAIQSQYRPQTQFIRTPSLLETLGEQLPEEKRIAYGSLLQSQPKKATTPIDILKYSSGGDGIGLSSGISSEYANVFKPDTINIGSGEVNPIFGTNMYSVSNDKVNLPSATGSVSSDTSSGGLFGTGVTGTDVANVAGVVAPIAALAGNSDLVKTAIALNLIGSAADIKSESDLINLGTKVAMLAAGPAGNALAAGLGLATDNTPLTVNALLSASNPMLGLVNTIAGNLTGYSIGDIASGLLNTAEGTVDKYGLLGAANIAKLDAASRKDATSAYDNMDIANLRVLSELGDTDARDKLASFSSDFGSDGSGGGKTIYNYSNNAE